MKIYHNAQIYAPGCPAAEALVIQGDRIVAIGATHKLVNAFNQAETIIDLGGRTLWPGLTDAHVHLHHLAASRTMVDCETDTQEACLERIQQAASKLAPNAWVRGHGWNQNRWAGGFGTAQQLDSVCNGHPAYLTAKSLHAAWVNSQALTLAGIDATKVDPPGGIIQRDATGAPTGILLEGEAMALIESVIPEPSPEEVRISICSLLPELWRMGLVGVHDFDGFDCYLALQELYQNGALKFRVRKNLPYDHLDHFINAGLRTDFGVDWLQIGGVKLFSDGALGSQTGAMLKPYEGSDGLGNLLLSEDELFEIGARAASHGLALTVHAIGDRANQVVLNAYERLRQFEQNKHLPHFRHRIEHVQIIQPDDLKRLAALDIIASVQPVHAPSDYQMADKFLGERSKFAYAYQSMLTSGAKLVFGSDAPVESVNPFIGIHAAVTRQTLAGNPRPDGWHPDERLSLVHAIDGFSHAPAVISNRGNRMGRLAPGYLADFILLEQNPFKIDPQDIGKLLPVATVIGGECVFQDSSLPFSL